MPGRRSHKKSRTGCRRCKNRKIKCDEVHPECGNCVRHSVPCDFSNSNILEESSPQGSNISGRGKAPQSPGFIPKAASMQHYLQETGISKFKFEPPMYTQTASLVTPLLSGQVDRMLELRLMHQFITDTANTLLNESSATGEICSRVLPQMAVTKPYLMDAILSIAALHLRSSTPDDKALAHASYFYSASTLTTYCTSLKLGITPDNAEALFMTAVLIAFQAIACRLFAGNDIDSDPDDYTSRYTPPISWFHHFQGVKTMVAASWSWIRDSAAVKAVITHPIFQLDLYPQASSSFFGHLLEGIEEELSTEDPLLVNATAQAYSHAVCVISWAHQEEHSSATLSFLVTASSRYVELVEAKRPRALVILASFFALLKRMDTWWLQDVARREVMGLVGMFRSGSKWWQRLEWPVRIALWDGDTIPRDIWSAK
ncbi:unnamed protein product [Fusarium fujikuroi]|uniref:Zn(2)-C6 fungal-type domain-containing protein n=1 Tax=Fusarium fujikuroi TaxID=5127 RepID=A0A9Q9RWQ2_FUSFU|nr:unnamed protein product [Fusarium fujikuroi]VZI11095.1 unnamed protein product [Fusarium fujikuroi]